MLLFSALVAGSFSLGARVADVVDPVAFTALRFWVAALVIGAALWATGGLRRPAHPGGTACWGSSTRPTSS